MPAPEAHRPAPATRLGAGLLALAAILPACAAEPPASDAVVRDSAGITIVENLTTEVPAGAVLELSVPPSVAVGSLEGTPETQLYRVSAVRRAPDGSLLVANTGTSEVRRFGPDGVHLASLGGEGDGPGEFRMLTGAWPWPGDSVAAFDMSRGSITLFGPSGTPARTIALRTDKGSEVLAGLLADGSLVSWRSHRSAPGIQRHVQSRVFFHRDADGELLDSLGAYPWIEVIPRQVGENTWMMEAPVFSARGQYAVGGEHVYAAVGDLPEVHVLDPGRGLVRIIRWTEPNRIVRPADRQAFRQAMLSRAESEEERRDLTRMMDDSEWSETFPSMDGLLVAPEGRLWVKRYRRPGEEGPQSWLIFDPEGRLEAEARLPEELAHHRAGREALPGAASAKGLRIEAMAEHEDVAVSVLHATMTRRATAGALARSGPACVPSLISKPGSRSAAAILRKASTTWGSNLVPLFSSIHSAALLPVQGCLYGRSWVSASKTSATATMRPGRGIASPARPGVYPVPSQFSW